MKVLICGDAGSLHTFRWATLSYKAGIEVRVFSLNAAALKEWKQYPDIQLHYPSKAVNADVMKGETGLSKLRYLFAIKNVKRVIADFQPDIVHAHYATSYGLIAVLTRFKNLAISVWGSDIFDFPRKSPLHARLIRYILSKPKVIQSTGEVMAEEARKYTTTPVKVIPFGINLDVYYPHPEPKDWAEMQKAPIIGTVKSMEKIYGIDVLITAFNLVKKKLPEARLVLVGSGSQQDAYKQLVADLGIAQSVVFTGKVPPTEVPEYLRSFDVLCNLSRRESFGMSILEASACGVPVVATHIDGVVETAQDQRNALTVDSDNAQAAADAILKILSNQELYHTLRQGGIQLVKETYDETKIRKAIPFFYESVR